MLSGAVDCFKACIHKHGNTAAVQVMFLLCHDGTMKIVLNHFCASSGFSSLLVLLHHAPHGTEVERP